VQIEAQVRAGENQNGIANIPKEGGAILSPFFAFLVMFMPV
jgi:hypothetical protein